MDANELCDSDSYGWSNCVNNNKNSYRTKIDSSVTSPNTKMNIAKRVAKAVVANNPKIRFGLFSFEDKATTVGGTERGQGAIKRADVKDMTARTYASPTPATTTTVAAANKVALDAAIDGLNGRTSTPLAEGLLEISRYLGGKSSIYKTGTYTSPIQYRCQKNFALVITDGDASDEDDFTAEPYTARETDGTAVSKSFSVCTAANSIAADGKTVNCPAGLEKTDGTFTAARDFGSGSNRISALRDVAMYGQVADLRVGGTDLDGKSFDESPFFKQTVETYTVGFGVINDVLPAAAKVGGGKYYSAANEAQLSTSLTNAIDSIVASTSNAGGLASQSEVSTAGNKLFQPVFNPNGWYGELRCFYLVNGIKGGACAPNAKATISAAASRSIFSSKVAGTTTTSFPFNDSTGFSNMSSVQLTQLGADAAAQKNTINFLRGTEGITGFRTRPVVDGVTTFLGDIIDGQPVVVSPPGGYTNATDYAAFKTTNSARSIVLVGANDGMLHAFNGDSMEELAGYIPSAVYPRLKALTASDYGLSGGTLHTYHVNGSMFNPMDFKTSATGSWKTIAVGGLGQGGQGYYALDTTNASSFNSAPSMVKWEWTDESDASMGYSFGMPIMSSVRTSTTATVPAVIFSNGYENNFDDTSTGGKKTSVKSAALFIVKADDGTLLTKIDLPTTGTYKSEGLSTPWGVDVGQDGILDYVYAGDVNGNMWRFDLTGDTVATFKVAKDAGGSAAPIFKAPAGQPIIMRPATLDVYASTGADAGNMVLFGTGQLLTDADRTTTTTQSLYGILDKMAEPVVTTTITSLQQQTINTDTFTVTATGSLAGTFRKVSTNDVDVTDPLSTKLGWYINLPTSSERLVASPRIYSNRVLFGTGIPLATEQCTPGGTGWIMGLNPLTGSVTTKNNVKPSTGVAFSFIDINGDSKSSVADKVGFSSGSAYVSGIATAGIPTELTYVASSSDLTTLPALKTTDPYSGSGSFVAMRETNSQGVARGSDPTGRGTKGQTINRIESKGDGTLCSGTVGSDSVQCVKLPPPPTSGVKVEHTVWREIK